MAFRKASCYKRFNVGEYMKQKRLCSLAVTERSKKAKAVMKKLKRLDDKVRQVLVAIDIVVVQ